MVTTRAIPDSEVPAKTSRRRFTAAEKARILDAYDAASAIERAALVRRERIYSSLLSNWRKQRNSGAPLASKRGRKADPEAVEMTQLQKRNAVLEQKLAKANQVIDIQGKVYALLRACAGESADQLDLPPWNKRSSK
jgi:transposase-like protein